MKEYPITQESNNIDIEDGLDMCPAHAELAEFGVTIYYYFEAFRAA
jgi:hypothetical protein